MQKITITKPDDWHLHLRQGAALETTVSHSAQHLARAVIMPNTIPPIVDIESAIEYKKQILTTLAEITKSRNNSFQPLMTLYLTDNTTPEVIKKAAASPDVIGCKLYPQGVTTNSSSGVSDITHIYPILEAMEKNNLALLIHGEVTDKEIDIFDREKVFIDSTLVNIREKFPALKITLEHITTKHAVDFVLENYQNNLTAATITPHHLLLNRNDLLVGGIKPHYYCLPILKNKDNQTAVQQAALSGLPCFFAGSDSAPHAVQTKEAACGCAGIYHGPNTLLVYAHFFDEFNSIDKLENFTSHFGSDYYNLNRNIDKITLIKDDFIVPEKYKYEKSYIVPFWAGKRLSWCFD